MADADGLARIAGVPAAHTRVQAYGQVMDDGAMDQAAGLRVLERSRLSGRGR